MYVCVCIVVCLCAYICVHISSIVPSSTLRNSESIVLVCKLWIVHFAQNGAHIYVCGDAKNMAGDVHKVLVKTASEKGRFSVLEAENYFTKLEEASRYQKDVWVT